MKLEVKEKIIVFDEGHNMQNVAEEVLSLEFKKENLNKLL